MRKPIKIGPRIQSGRKYLVKGIFSLFLILTMLLISGCVATTISADKFRVSGEWGGTIYSNSGRDEGRSIVVRMECDSISQRYNGLIGSIAVDGELFNTVSAACGSYSFGEDSISFIPILHPDDRMNYKMMGSSSTGSGSYKGEKLREDKKSLIYGDLDERKGHNIEVCIFTLLELDFKDNLQSTPVKPICKQFFLPPFEEKAIYEE